MNHESAMHLISVIQELSAVRDLQSIMDIVRHAARKIAQADGATFVLRDGDHCFYADEDSIAPLWKGMRFPISACISGWTMIHKQNAYIEDIYVDPRIPIDAYRPTFVKSLSMTPIRKTDPIGAIGVYWASSRKVEPEVLEWLQALADSASVAMENVNLYESLQKRIDELKIADRAKDEFLMTISHELRTPMNSILGWSELLVEGRLSLEDVQLGHETIFRNATLQSRIIEDLLDGSSIVLGRLKLELAPVDLASVIRSAMEVVQLSAEKKRIELCFEWQESAAMVDGDAARLEQVASNLLMNAVKFSGDGGRIQISLAKNGPVWRIDVKDSGEGIDPQFLPFVFERFRQADGSMTRRHGGLGLGLAIVKSLVEAHHGSVSVTSDGRDKGSVFSFTIPIYGTLKTTPEIPSETASAPHPALQGSFAAES